MYPFRVDVSDEVEKAMHYRMRAPKDFADFIMRLFDRCRVVKRFDVGHPLMRGYIKFSCPEAEELGDEFRKYIEVQVHGDWRPEDTYVNIRFTWY